MTESEVVGLFERRKASVQGIGLTILRSREGYQVDGRKFGGRSIDSGKERRRK